MKNLIFALLLTTLPCTFSQAASDGFRIEADTLSWVQINVLTDEPNFIIDKNLVSNKIRHVFRRELPNINQEIRGPIYSKAYEGLTKEEILRRFVVEVDISHVAIKKDNTFRLAMHIDMTLYSLDTRWVDSENKVLCGDKRCTVSSLYFFDEDCGLKICEIADSFTSIGIYQIRNTENEVKRRVFEWIERNAKGMAENISIRDLQKN